MIFCCLENRLLSNPCMEKLALVQFDGNVFAF
jgi:hypothetical protein